MPADPFPVFGVAASAGGVEALLTVVAGLPDDFPACVLVVRHRTSGTIDALPDLLRNRTRRRVMEAADGDPLAPAAVYTARPGWHLVVAPGGALRLSDAPKVRHVRPAADVLFESMAAALGRRAVAVVLTGYDGDGSGGLAAVRAGGGRVLVQDPGTAAAPGMPAAALATGEVDAVAPLDGLARAMVDMAL